MRKRLIVIGCVALLCALAIPVYRSAAKAAPAPAMHAAVAPPDNHPEYRDALNDLRNARKHLEKAEADGYGHRDRAMRAVDEAISQCNQALDALH